MIKNLCLKMFPFMR